jgi:hypothetical protein
MGLTATMPRIAPSTMAGTPSPMQVSAATTSGCMPHHLLAGS